MSGLDAIFKQLIDALLPIADGFVNFIRGLLTFFGIPTKDSKPENRERILRAWITVAVFLIVLFLLFQTQYVKLLILEKKVSLLKDLNEIANNGVSSRSELVPIYNELVGQLAQGKVNIMNNVDLSLMLANFSAYASTPLFWFKFLSGAFLGLLLVLWTIAANRSNKTKAFRGALLVTIVFGLIGTWAPVVLQPVSLGLLLNGVILLILQVGLLSYIGRRSKLSSNPA